MKKILFPAALLSVLLACSLTTPRDVGNGNRMALEPLPAGPVLPQKRVSLTVLQPAVPPELDTYRVALLGADRRWDYFAGMRWADFLPGMIQSSLVATLSDAHLYRGVSADDVVTGNEYALETTILRFHAIYRDNAQPPEIVLEGNFVLRDVRRAKPMKQFMLTANARAAGNDSASVWRAFQAAWRTLQQDLLWKLSE